MAGEIDVFHFDDGRENFNDYAEINGQSYWPSSKLMAFLDYENVAVFEKVINKAVSACASLNIPFSENFKPIDGRPGEYRLSRFACYLIAMNGDPRKPQVAAAQAWFATVAESMRQYLVSAEDHERHLIRVELTDAEKSLSRTAKAALVTEYQLFQNAGYRGMYNMNLGVLKKKKGVPEGRTILDFMRKDELAANLFRITQTEARLQSENVKGQKAAEATAHTVGKTVRDTMIKLSNTKPESIPLGGDIQESRKKIQQSSKEFKKLDRSESEH